MLGATGTVGERPSSSSDPSHRKAPVSDVVIPAWFEIGSLVILSAVLIADPDTPDAKTLLAMADELAPEESYGTAANVPQTQAEEEKYPEPVKGTFLPERPLVGLLPKRWSPSKAILMPHAQLSLLGSRWSGSSKSTKQLAHTLLRL